MHVDSAIQQIHNSLENVQECISKITDPEVQSICSKHLDKFWPKPKDKETLRKHFENTNKKLISDLYCNGSVVLVLLVSYKSRQLNEMWDSLFSIAVYSLNKPIESPVIIKNLQKLMNESEELSKMAEKMSSRNVDTAIPIDINARAPLWHDLYLDTSQLIGAIINDQIAQIATVTFFSTVWTVLKSVYGFTDRCRLIVVDLVSSGFAKTIGNKPTSEKMTVPEVPVQLAVPEETSESKLSKMLVEMRDFEEDLKCILDAVREADHCYLVYRKRELQQN